MPDRGQNVKQITARELAAERGLHNAQWVDVRSASEYAAGHVPGAVNGLGLEAKRGADLKVGHYLGIRRGGG